MKELKELSDITGLMVTVNSPDRLEAALQKFRFLCKEAKLKDAIVEHMEFKSPGQKRREKKNRSINRYKWILKKETMKNMPSR